MRYGYFDDDHREYVITNPKTPVKWINYLGSLRFGGFVDQTGGVLLCKGDPTYNRITKYIPQLPAGDFKGETLYLRIKEGDGYKLFSPFFVPCLVEPESYECRVGLGYSRIMTLVEGLLVTITIFVPIGGECEIRDIRIENKNQFTMDIDAIPVVEYSHFDALKQFTNADWVPQTMQSRLIEDQSGFKTLAQFAFMRKETEINYLSCSLPVSSFESDRRIFLGDHEYSSWANPLTLKDPELANHEASRGDNIGALMIPLGELVPGGSRRFVTMLGQAASPTAALEMVNQFRNLEKVDLAFEELRRSWEKRLQVFQVSTPDDEANTLVNIHNPRQCLVTLGWSRYLSLYQLGLGSRGIGVRDSCQDLMGALPLAPGDCEALLERLISVQKINGSAMHQFNPLTMIASEGDALEREDRPHYYCDDHLWLVLATLAYVKETGNKAIFDKRIGYYEKDASGDAIVKACVLDHLKAALAFTKRNCGMHGLPLLGFADWNDTVNLASGSESVFAACLYGRALLEMAALMDWLGDTDQSNSYLADHAEMAARVNQYAWDGEWYISYFDSDGVPLGSHRNQAGQIYAYGQAWPILAGFASPERARKALESTEKYLATREGIKLSTPGFNGFDPEKGGITTYPPGAKENGGIFLHVNPWVMIAETMAGTADRAYDYFARINPVSKNDRIEVYECEPYVFAQNVLGDEHLQFGLARNSWLSGTASWMYQAFTQHILGIRPDFDGLVIDPCIPSHWEGFSARREFRGAIYHISVLRTTANEGEFAGLEVDGEQISGNVVPSGSDGKEHEVRVSLPPGYLKSW